LNFIAQEDGTWCFVCGLANCAIYLGLDLPDLAEAKRIARCEHGAAICHTETVQFFGLPLKRTSDPRVVLECGGVMCIHHPIYNGHVIFVFPDGPGSVTMVNSWLGPLVAKRIGHDELLRLTTSSFTNHWALSLCDACTEKVEALETGIRRVHDGDCRSVEWNQCCLHPDHARQVIANFRETCRRDHRPV